MIGMICDSCHAEMPDGSLFCKECGTRMETIPQPPSAKPVKEKKKIPKKKIAICIVAILIVGLFIASLGSYASVHNGEYNYTVTYTDSFVSSSGYNYAADEGKTFAVTTITLKNLNYTGTAISTNSFNFNLLCSDGLYYGHCLDTYSHPGYNDTASLSKGASYTFTILFEVPKDVTDSSLKWNGFVDKVYYNPDL